MNGETDLRLLLGNMRPQLSKEPYAFAVSSSNEVPAGLDYLATFREDRGLTIIGPFEQVRASGLPHAGPWGLITLTIHSSLAAVGLTAAVASALARAGISANVVAAYFHDHLFVPWEKRAEAMDVLERLATSGQAPT